MADKVTQTEASRAFRLRKKLRDGKPLPEKDRVWLREYTARTTKSYTPPERQLSAPPATAAPGSEPPEVRSEVPSAEGGDGPPPLPFAPSPQGQTPPGSESGSASSESTSAPKEPKSNTSAPTDEQRARSAAYAEILIAYVRQCNAELKELGATPVPEFAIEQVYAPCARELAARLNLGGHELGETEMGVVVVAGTALTVGRVHLIKAKRKKEAERPIIDVNPAPAPAGPPPPPPPRGDRPRKELFWEMVQRRGGGGPDTPVAGGGDSGPPLGEVNDRGPF